MALNPFASSENVPGVQKQNIAWMKAQTELMVAQRKYMEEVNKTKKETWEAMTESVISMERFSSAGGINQIFGGSITRFKNNIALGLEGALTGVTNAFVGAANDILEKLTPVFDALGVAFNTVITGLEGIDIGGDQSFWDGLMAALSGVAGLTFWIFTDWLPALFGWGSKTEEFLTGGGLAAITGVLGGGGGGGDGFYDPYLESRIQKGSW